MNSRFTPLVSRAAALLLLTTLAAPHGVRAEGAIASARPHPAFAAFNAWMEKHAAAPAGPARAALAAEGEGLALRRRQALVELIRQEPREALAWAVPVPQRRSLPVNVRQHLEERVSGRGRLGVMVADDFERGVRKVTHEAVLNGRRYEAHVYGRRAASVTRHNVPLWGIAVGPVLAVHEQPARRLEPAEAPALGAERLCTVSGRPAGARGTAVFADVGGSLEAFCSEEHFEQFNARLALEEGDTGGDDPPVAEDGWTQGPKRVLFMRVTWPDEPTEAITEADAHALMDTVNAWYTETSYHTTWLVTDVTPLMVLPQSKAWYCENGDSYILSDARVVARDYGFDTDNYQLDIARFPSPGSGCTGYSYSGKAYVRGKGCWMLSNSSGTMIHELGHNYGVWHANFWNATGDSVIGPGSNVEYGNSYDVMGSSGSSGQFNAAFKNQLDWLQNPFVESVSASGTYRIHTFDVPALTAGRKYALKVRKDYDRNYWAEFRQKYANRWFLNGVILNWDPWNNGVTNSASGAHLLDTTPGTPTASSSKEDSAVVLGRTFSDAAAGVHLTPVARGNTTPENWMDVVVNLGQFPSNRPPDFTLTADRTTVVASQDVYFFASAGDPDGDALAYAWDFGDLTFGPNAPAAAKSWATNGEYLVRCTVSDMKGGLRSRHVVVTVGNPGRYQISGRVLADGAPLEGVRVHNGQSGSAYRGAYTDSDGYYVLANLSAGSHNLSAVKYGYTLSLAGWANPVTVGPNATGRDFAATLLPHVGFTVTDAQAGEGGPNPGRFTLTRRGPTNAPLTVLFNRTGLATLNTDYTFNPAPTGAPPRLVLPAGAASLDLVLNPINDSSSEGPETVTLTLVEDASYVVAPLAEASIVIEDDEAPARPTLTITANNSNGPENDNLATESGGDTATFLISRSGNVAGELLVNYAVSGTASNGVDYAPLYGLAAIPAGESSVVVPLRVLDDVELEGNETVTVTLLASAAYTLGSPANASITILDDDPPTVTVVATDGIATEAGPSGATVVFNRIGSPAANLVVNYTLGGTAGTNDINALSGSITIPAGRPNVSLAITPVNDTLLEGDETLVIAVAPGPVYNVGNPGSASILIQDNEIPTITLAASDNLAAEPGSNTGAFTFTHSSPTNAPLTVAFAVSGTATPDFDYVPLVGPVSFAAGVTSVVVLVTPLDDPFPEIDERVTVQLLPDPAYNVGTTAPQTVTLRDNDSGLPAVEFRMAAMAYPESVTTVRLGVVSSTNAGSGVSVDYAVTGGTASSGSDFTVNAGTLRFPPGEVITNLTFSVSNDTAVESNETIVITFSNPTNCVLGPVATHTYTILDDDAHGAVTVTAVDASASETGPDPGRFRFTRGTASTNALTVFFQVVGSANSPSDYAPLPDSVTIPAGSNSVDLVVMPVDDVTPETNESVTVNLTVAPGARIGSPDTATVLIADNDTYTNQPIVRITALDAVASEPGTDTGAFTISRDRGTDTALTVNFTVGGSATSGTDFLALGTAVTIPAGAWATNLTVTPRDDAVAESNETVVVTLTTLGAYRVAPTEASATVTLVDNEALVWVTASGESAEDGASLGYFTLTRTGTALSNLPVHFTLSGSAGANDFAPLGSPVTIPAGSNTVTFPLVPVNDGVLEGNETVVLTLVPGAGYTLVAPTNAAVLVVDSGLAPPTVSLASSNPLAGEWGPVPGSVVVLRSGPTNQPLTVRCAFGGTASNGVDYAFLPDTVTIAAGSSAAALSVWPVSDGLAEGDETVTATVLPDPAYALSDSNTVTLTLRDRPWDDWRFARFTPAELDDPEVSGERGDPDADARLNLLEYAFNFDPKAADAQRGFTGAMEDGPEERRFVVRFTRRLPPTDVGYVVEVTTDFQTWSNGPDYTEELLPPSDDGNGLTETARVEVFMPPGDPQRFVRLQVTLRAPR